MSTAICICTHRRPNSLRRLLHSLTKLQGPAPDIVCIVDNDPSAEGLAVARSMQLDPNFPLAIAAEALSAGGISVARNRVVRMALDRGAEYLALIDDDEWPEPQWLCELLRVQALDNADAIGGPTRPVFSSDAPDICRRSIYYGADMALHENAHCHLQACGNVLLRSAAMENLEQPWFDPALGFSGGEDLAFFNRLAADRLSMRWAPTAVVHEEVPPQRARRDWLAKRATLIANTRVIIDTQQHPQLRFYLQRWAKTCALGLQTLMCSIGALLRGPQARDDAWLLRAKFIGKLRAHLGHKLQRGDDH